MNAKIEQLAADASFVDESHKGSKFSVTLITFIALVWFNANLVV